MKSEHAIQNEILVALSKHDCTVYRSNAGQAWSASGQVIKLFPKGHPDITGFKHSDGRVFFIEVKNERGRLRDDQVKYSEFLSKFPVIHGVARSVNDALKIVDEEIVGYGYEN